MTTDLLSVHPWAAAAHPPLRCRQLAGGGWWHSLYGAIMTFTENSSTVVGGVAECASPQFAVADQEGT